MKATLRKAKLDDVDALCNVYMSAFTHEIFSRQVFPRLSGTGRAYWSEAFSEELQEPDATFLVATDPASSTPDKIVGYVKWVRPDAAAQDYSEDGYPEDGLPEVASEFYKKLFEGHKRNMGETRHWYLDMMAVEKDSMGKGLARQMMEWGLQKAREDGVVCFVEATADARPFYEHFGFREIDRMGVDTPEGRAEVIFMVRDIDS
ncbi:acetyltransferase, GNAT family [Pochonia chlamydosporia 170]|uniref:Acetyltransferase, GNAT family n=1 Tax=Pochonia chlamydosporia 170 TaxID=1380566 RepID=A0A179FI27_METCM|nr:acetyltransferase, GNAT family [Pochonia chlamydosporia 170]OAQ65192.1 acetyltransferase, GNAT family [Pochonia chlamydosporia 170]